jgi:hypothetical protein
MMEIIIWFFILFVLTFVSLLLTMRSLQNYREKAKDVPVEYGLYLIRYPQLVTETVIDHIMHQSIKIGASIAFEKLAKGDRKALVVYGPKQILQSFVTSMSFMEIEDYTIHADSRHINAWEVRVQSSHQHPNFDVTLESQMPHLEEDEQIWYQVVTRPIATGLEYKLWRWFISTVKPYLKLPWLVASMSKESLATIRVVYLCDDTKKRHEKLPHITKIGETNFLFKMPQKFTSKQILDFYRDRSLPLSGHQVMRVGLYDVMKWLN